MIQNDDTSDESLLWRDPPARPYVRAAAVLRVPGPIWQLTLEVFRATALRRVEAVCYWYGTRDDDGNGEVHAVAVPRQRNGWGNYLVTAEAMAAVAASTRPSGWLNLSQVHTHPGRGIEHSRFDDANANSRRALSVVIPYYGRWAGAWPQGIGVHEFQEDYWHLLTDDDASQRVTLTERARDPILVDLR